MQYSLVKSRRLTPFPKGRGLCEVCHNETLAKCGKKVRWHWAHKESRDCDPWWENETEWHRKWKSEFPESCREVAFKCFETGEIHRADIIANKGIVLEIQNSPISLDEMRSREIFYKNLVWIVNGEKFKKRFRIFDACLPDPQSNKFEDIMFMASKYEPSCSMFWRKSENPEAANKKGAMVRVHSAKEIEAAINESYKGHHPFYWSRPHIAWLEAKCPVLIDFGQNHLWRIESYKNQFLCVRRITKAKVIHDVKHELKASDIASKFYPMECLLLI